jgi:hypothetical protein
MQNNTHRDMAGEFAQSQEEREECEFIDAVLLIMPEADTEDISDLMTSGYSPAQVAVEIKAQYER